MHVMNVPNRIHTTYRRMRAWPYFEYLAIFGLALAFRLIKMIAEPLGQDEFFTDFWSLMPVKFLFGEGARLEANPPHYFVLMHYWMQVFGNSHFSLRFLPTLFSSLTPVLVYAIGTSLFDRNTARVAGLLAAMNALTLIYAEEARAYALMGFFNTLTILALARYWLTYRETGKGPLVWAGAVAGALALSVYGHYTSFIFAASCGLAVAIFLLTTRAGIREYLVWGTASLVLLLATASSFWQAQHISSSADIAWIKPTDWKQISFFLLNLFSPTEFYLRFLACAAAAIVVMIVVASPAWRDFRPRHNPIRFITLIVIPVVYVVLIVAASFSRPILVPRIGIWLISPLSLIVARAVVLYAPTRLRLVVFSIAVWAFGASTLAFYSEFHKIDWQTPPYLAAMQPKCSGPLIYGHPAGLLGLAYYRSGLIHRPLYSMAKKPYVLMSSYEDLTEATTHARPMLKPQLEAFIAHHPGTVLFDKKGENQKGPLQNAPTIYMALRDDYQLRCY